MPPCSTHVHLRPKFPIQFLPDPRIFLVSILPMAQPLLPNTGYTRGTKTKDAFLSVTIQFRGFASLTWMAAHINTCTYVDHPAFLSLAQHSLQWCCLWRKMAGQNCSWQEMSRRNSGKEETFYEHNPIHVLQTVLLSLLLAHGQTQSKSVSLAIPGIASCLHFGSGWKTVVFKMYLVQCNAMSWSLRVTILVWGTVRGVPNIITFCPAQWKLLSRQWWRFCSWN